MKFIQNNLFKINVDVSTSTEVFFETVCLFAVRHSDSGRTGLVVVDVGELIRPLVSVHRLVLFLPDMYRLLDPLSTLLLSLSMTLT